MRPESENEMEQIQKGLEQFLKNEVEEKYYTNNSKRYYTEDVFEETDGEYADEYNENEEEYDNEYNEEYDEIYADEEDDEDDRIEYSPRKASQMTKAERSRTEKSRTEKTKADKKKSDRTDSNRTNSSRTKTSSKSAAAAPQPRKKKKHRLTGILVKIAVVLAILFAGLYLMVGLVYPKMTYQESTALMDGGLKENGVTSILLIGSDSRTESNDGRSDAMILLTISDKTRTVHMTSLLRDMYVEIPGYGGNRLNAAYAYGGAELLLETIRENFGVEVYRYAVVNFSAFAGLVDAVEGVDIELTNEEVQWVNAYLNEYNELRGMPMETDYLDTSLSGTLRLNGAQALAYSRNRYIGSDFGRTERQRKVLSAVMQKLPKAVVKNSLQLVNGLFPNLTTNLTQLECTRLCTMAPKLLIYDTVQDSIPLDGTYSNATIRQMSVLEVDFDQNRAYIQSEIYGK